MTDILTIVVSTALVNNLILIQLTGVTSFFIFSNRIYAAGVLGFLTAVITIISSPINFLIYNFALVPFNLEYLRLVLFVLISATTSILLLKHVRPGLLGSLQRQRFPIVVLTANSAVLGISLMVTRSKLTFIECLAYSFGAAIGFAMLLLLMAAVRERLETADAPRPFRGTALDMLSTGIAAMAIMGFAGIV